MKERQRMRYRERKIKNEIQRKKYRELDTEKERQRMTYRQRKIENEIQRKKDRE